MEFEFEKQWSTGKETSLSDPRGLVHFPWGMWFGIVVFVLLLFWGVGAILFFSGSADLYFMIMFEGLATGICSIMILVGIVGYRRTQKVKRELAKGKRIDQIKL